MKKDVVKEESLVSGYKADEAKVRLDLIPPEFIFAVGEVMTYGANKYADRNWEKGMKWSRPFAAAMRHLWAWWAGRGPTNRNFLFGSEDDETRFSHLWHAACCLAFLVSFEERMMVEWDDRFTGPDDIEPATEAKT
jgi:hypothetical protein